MNNPPLFVTPDGMHAIAMGVIDSVNAMAARRWRELAQVAPQLLPSFDRIPPAKADKALRESAQAMLLLQRWMKKKGL